MTETEDRVINWDDPVEVTEEPEYRTLKPGEYSFQVTDFTRDRFDGSEKIPACPMAVVSFFCIGDDKVKSNADQQFFTEGYVTERFFMTEKQQWKVINLFKACGLIPASTQAGEKIVLPWHKLKGSEGRLIVKNHTYDDKIYNNVGRFIIPKAAPSAASAAPGYGSSF